jgi:SAM-dependent methyltransferase
MSLVEGPYAPATRQGRKDLAAAYDRLLQAPELSHLNRFAKPNLETYRPRHELLLLALDENLRGARNRIADIGCHSGFFLRMASHLGFQEFIAVDAFPLAPEASFLTDLGTAVHFIQADFNEPGFLRDVEDGSVDCVVSTEVFEHIFDHPVDYLRDVWRTLRGDGLMLLSTPNPSTVARAIRILRAQPPGYDDLNFALIKKVSSDSTAIAFRDLHFREYMATDLRKLLLDLPGASIVDSGFIASASNAEDPLFKRASKNVAHALGLGRRRLISQTQFYVIRKDGLAGRLAD